MSDTTIAQICEKWTMVLEAPEEGHDEWFLDWVLRSPRSAGTHLTAGFLALQAMAEKVDPAEVRSVREYFAGMGAQALMVREIFEPEMHVVQDYSAEAVAHLRRVLPPDVDALQADSYDPSCSSPADLVMLDFGDLTAWKTRDGEGHRRLLDRVFAHRPRGVLLTDIAARYLHLHRERYESLLGAGTCGSYETYLTALVARLGDLYGYGLHRGYMDRWSTVMALVPLRAKPEGLLVPTPAEPLGLELL